MKFTGEFWDEQYLNNRTGWDIGYVSTPLKEYFDQLRNKDIFILIPGAGRAWEAEYLFNKGFVNTFVLDYSAEAVMEFHQRVPQFPKEKIITDDFFSHNGRYDLIIEQTFFSSLFPQQRKHYALTVDKLLKNEGKLVGLLFNHKFNFDGPPFGGTENEYFELFKPYFELLVFETAYNSIKPRKGRELFILLQKRYKEV